MQKNKSALRRKRFCYRAANEARTRDPQLGRLMLYQLSYCRTSFCTAKVVIFFEKTIWAGILNRPLPNASGSFLIL